MGQRYFRPPRVSLRSIGGPVGDEIFELGQAAISLGRAPDNNLIVADSKASRRHARIEFRDGGYWLTDLDSSNGTFVNQARMREPHRLQSGDAIGIGDARFVFQIATETARRAAASAKQSEEGSITGMIQSLEADKPAPPRDGPEN